MAETVYLTYSRPELEAAWALVAPREHWKAPIEAYLPKETPEATALAIKAAIEFYTATTPAFHFVTRRGETEIELKVTAVGYWAGPAGP